MTTTQIRCFLEAAKSLNFTYAASKLYISPSTLSKSILALEKELGLQLFIRDRRGIRLTPGGTLLCQRMTPFLDEMPNWIHQAQLANQGLNGTLRIGYLATQHINTDCAQHIAAFEEKYQNIHVSIQYENFNSLLGKLRANELDIAVSATFDVQQQYDLNYQEFVRVENHLVLPDSYTPKRSALLRMEQPALADFADETFLTVADSESSCITPLLLHSCAQAGFTPHLLPAPNFETLLLWLEMGRGIFALNKEHMIYSSNKIRVFSLPEFPPITLSIVWLKQTENPCVSLLVGELPKL